MDIFKEHYCRLCLSFKANEKYELIDNFTRDVLSVLSLKLNFDEKKTYEMCTTCSEKLKAAFEFKSTCLATGDTIFPYIDGKEELQVDLGEIYMKEIENEHSINLPSKIKICSLCLRPVGDEFIVVREEEVNVIHKFVSEMNMDAIKDPVVCKCCFDSLNTHSSFLSDCLEIDKKIGHICHSIATNQSDVQTLQEKYQDRSQDVVEENHRNVKMESSRMKLEVPLTLEYSVPSDSQIQNIWILGQALQRQPQTLKLEQSESQILEQGTSGQVSKCTQKFKCDKCKYQSMTKQDFYKHLLWHKECKDNQIHKCKKCEFQSKILRNLHRHAILHREIFRMYKCAQCEYQTTVRVSYRKHLGWHRKHPGMQIYNCDKKNQEMQIYNCDKCEYQTKVRRYFCRHKLRHERNKEKQIYKCEKCEFQSTIERNLHRHQLKHKTQVYICKECKYQSTSRGSFSQHQSRHKQYKGAQMYKCDKCNYQTKIWRYFYAHMSKHEMRKDT